ncbi:FAD-binding protein [Microbacterium sp. LRZ72]|uniref:FAD-binding oxidoreductase n=1 Tax=Microbacterium sp. LRZ72 TaxID=2942481 RepID=UPI0029B8EF50|nr:FAD-linked oxidase C-terminal domain-containing protein [Microbacterium sp. LRZ72]MDX2376356.1 FAD-binding protein [Microbacterium sp. LRZ72]
MRGTDGGRDEVVARLRDALGVRVSVDPDDLETTRTDASGHRSGASPLAVVSAESVEDVQATMRIATDTRTPVVTRGAGTGAAGGAIAGAGQIVLSTLRMTSIHEIRPDDLLAVVDPGIFNGELNAVLAEQGLWWAPDPASREISTVGGNIATGAGGLLCAKYGAVREAVLGVDVVVPDGRLLRLGHRSVKGVTGLDLTALMVGSEGTLGVIVRATLKLRRKTLGAERTILGTFPDVRSAAAASAAVTAAGLQPALMELMDSAALAAVHDLLGLVRPAEGTAHLTIQTDGPAAADEAEAIAAVLGARGGETVMSDDPTEGERLLAIRRSAHAAMQALGDTLLEDIAVPRSALPAMFDEIARIEREFGLVIPTVAHAGDGNLHPSFVFEGPEVPDVVWAAASEMFSSALRLGGTLTGEHGVGVLKSRWLADELGDDQWELQRRIKEVFDPLCILNPGKVFAR